MENATSEKEAGQLAPKPEAFEQPHWKHVLEQKFEGRGNFR